MLSININKLRSEVEDRENNKIKIFEKILDMCYQKILNTNKQNNDYSCTFVVPNVVFGLPLYNIEDCIIFIMNKLVEKGFEIYFALPTSIHIFWRPKDYINKSQNQNQNQLEYYSSLQQQNPSNQLMIKYNDIYNTNSTNSNNSNNSTNSNNSSNSSNTNEKTHKTTHTNVSKTYRPIETYKTTSHSIYDLDNLDIFENKVTHLF
jgi:hypothetical protein